MTEYIEREAAVTIADYAVDEHPYDKNPEKSETFSEYNQGWHDACDYVRDKLEQLPADVAPVRHGWWILERGDCRCATCRKGYKIVFGAASPASFHYCSNCGAKMDGGDEV